MLVKLVTLTPKHCFIIEFNICQKKVASFLSPLSYINHSGNNFLTNYKHFLIRLDGVFLIQILHEDGEFPEYVSQFPLNCLPLQNQGSNLHQVLVALHAFIVPGKNNQN
jgi:hypothetical protein